VHLFTAAWVHKFEEAERLGGLRRRTTMSTAHANSCVRWAEADANSTSVAKTTAIATTAMNHRRWRMELIVF